MNLSTAMILFPAIAFSQPAAQIQQRIPTIQNEITNDGLSIANIGKGKLISGDADVDPGPLAVGEPTTSSSTRVSGSGSTFIPPGRTTTVVPTMSLASINATLAKAGSGNTVVFSPGAYPLGSITVPSGVYVYSPSACAAVLSGNVKLGSNSTLDGFQLNNALVDMRNTRNTSVGRNCFNGGAPARAADPSAYPGNIVVWVDEAHNYLVVNNSFKTFPGGGVYGWNNTGRIAGNQFMNGRQAIDLNFTTVEIDHNYASGLTRMFVELGSNPDGDTSAGVKVHDNYEENIKPIPDAGAQPLEDSVAYSIVPAKGSNNSVINNFVSAAPGACGIGIELNNSGAVSGNHIINCNGGIVVYGTQPQSVSNNNLVGTVWGFVVNYSNSRVLIESGNVANSSKTVPAKPISVSWH